MESTNSTSNFTHTPLDFTYSPPPPSSLPTAAAYPELHHQLPAIIAAACALLAFGGCVIVLATCCWSGRSGTCGEGCASGENECAGDAASNEPQLKLWKRLGSGRYSFSSSFRRTPQRSALSKSKRSFQLEQDRKELQAQLTIPCLLQYATEI